MMGHQDVVVNVRGTSAETFITTQEGDDAIFISSDANENITTARSVDVLFGWLDYIEKDLHVMAQSGRHRLLLSDMFSPKSKGSGTLGAAELTRSSLTGLADTLGDIYFNSTNGNWYDGVNIWLGQANDILNVTSIPSAVNANRTTTSVHAGNGSDTLLINLKAEENVGALFVANGQGDDDILDASSSSLAVVLFGDGGADNITGGTAEDILIGDFGLVTWVDSLLNDVVAVAGGGGYGDYTDGVHRSVYNVESMYFEGGGNDTILGGKSRDVIIGGDQHDTIEGNEGADICFGDFGMIAFNVSLPNLQGLTSIVAANCSEGGPDTIYGNEDDDVLM